VQARDGLFESEWPDEAIGLHASVVVWRVDRLGRSLIDVLNTVNLLRERGVQVRSISDGIDPATSTGRLMLNMLATLAEYERELIVERVNAGIAAARQNGRSRRMTCLGSGGEVLGCGHAIGLGEFFHECGKGFEENNGLRRDPLSDQWLLVTITDAGAATTA
jgi:hypothetical protein